MRPGARRARARTPAGTGALLAPALAALALAHGPGRAVAEVVRVEIVSRVDVLGGRPFGEAGAYEKLVGRVRFAFDPANPANARVVDLALAPRNGRGRVEAWAELVVLQPKDRARRRGVAWLEVPNRGGKASLRYFNRAAEGALDPVADAHFGDGLLLREGLTLIWVGWQWDVPDGEGLMRLHVPFARRPNGSPLTGTVRADWVVEAATERLALAHRSHRSYAVADPDDPANNLTVRDARDGAREIVARERWRFVRPSGAERTWEIAIDGGFEPGRIYELVYRSRDPRIVGLGPAAVRDVASYAKHSLDTPLPVDRVVAFGVSQTGRFLRHYLYDGFNTDEGGRIAVDGMLVHTAGAGRGTLTTGSVSLPGTPTASRRSSTRRTSSPSRAAK